MSYREMASRDGGRHHTDPSSSRFHNNSRYHQRGRLNNRPVPNRRPTGGDDLQSITVSIGRNLTTDGVNAPLRSVRGRFINQRGRPQQIYSAGSRFSDREASGIQWWRVSIPQVGTIGKERVMSTLKAHFPRQLQPYHYFIDRTTNMGVFFVNSQQDADMLKRANKKVEVLNFGVLSIMVSPASSPAPLLDEDLRRHFRDYMCNRRYDPQTYQLQLASLADDEELSALGIYPQLNKKMFIQEVIDIINKDLPLTRQLDLGSNSISNLYEFRNLQLNNLEQLSLASNQLSKVEELGHLKQLTHLSHLFLKDNPLTTSRRNGSPDELTSCILQRPFLAGPVSCHSSAIRQRLPQLKRIDGVDLPAQIGFAIDIESVNLPSTAPHCVPQELQSFLAKFIDEYYRLFDTRGRAELHACYHDSCILSVCIVPTEGSMVPTKPYKYGPLIYDSRNFKKIFDDNKRAALLRHGKSDVLDFLRVKYPLTKHEGKSFHVDVISTANNRAIFTVNGLYREVDQGANGPVRTFQRTFTCLQTPSGVLIVADHVMIINATDAQVNNLNRAPPPPTTQTMESQSASGSSSNSQDQLVQRLSRQSGMNIQYSKLCLSDNNWDYDRALLKFQELQRANTIPAEAFKNI